MGKILIVGAGAAGCALARLLAKSGRSVTIVERRRVGEKDKLCGGVLNGAAQRLMRKLYGEGVLEELGTAHVGAMRVLYRAKEATLPMEEGFRTLPRARLDAFLLDQALAEGVRLIEGTAVVGVDEAARLVTARNLETGAEEQIPYDVLVAADGALSVVRTLATGRRPRTVTSLEAACALPADGNVLVQRVYPAIAGGSWLIPQGDRAIVGCLFFPEASHEPVGDQAAKVRDLAEEMGCAMGSLRGAPVPTGDDVLLRTPGGTCLVGDAAGLIDPALGAGIHHALHSAFALFRELAHSARYEDEMAEEIERMRRKVEGVAFTYLKLGVCALRNEG